jgi:hypothetical protein
MCIVCWSYLLILSCAALTRSVQITIQVPTPPPNFKSTMPDIWDFNATPSLNSTSHLIFDTVGSLAQHWTNTRYRNGHTVVPGTVPIGTLLYHGTDQSEVPTEPDWIATDPDHSYVFCRTSSASGNSGCWHLTLVVTRPLRVLYFDGSSAAKMQGGPMDSQDITVWGQVKPEWTWNERKRINDLCEWGRKFGLDGFMRMEMDFEIMLCDFANGVEIVSHLNLDPGKDAHPAGPEQELPSSLSPSATYVLQYRSIEAGGWHNTYPGETRVKLGLNRLISFYDTNLFPSLVFARFGQERWKHRLQGLDAIDLKTFQARLGEVLKQNDHAGSGVDWSTLIHVVIDRYAERLEILHYLLNTTTTAEHVKRVQGHLRSMLVQHILYTSMPNSGSTNYSWAVPVYEHCATTHTRYTSSTPSLSARMSKSESLILHSIQEVSKEICRVVVGMWAGGVELGFDTIPTSPSSSSAKLDPETATTIRQWKERTEGLMAWLDWSVWVRCRPECGYEEICYLPTWPFLDGPDWLPWPHVDEAMQLSGEGGEERFSVRPTPKCIRRVEPFRV